MASFVKFIFLAYLSTSTAAPSGNIGVRWLFPDNKLYAFDLKSNISTGSVLPAVSASQHTLQARLNVQVFNETRLKLQLDNVKTALYNTNGHAQSNPEGAQSLPYDAGALTKPWEAHYWLESGVLYAVQLADDEPLWSSNIKRALAISLQLSRVNTTDAMYRKSYTVVEPCLHDTCQAEYSGVDTNTVRKSHGIPASTRGFGRNVWFSVRPDICNKDIKQPFIGNAERVYQLDDRGLYSMDLRSSLEYHSHNHLLAVVTEVSLYRDQIMANQMDSGPALNSTYPAYYSHTYKDPTNGRQPASQQELLTRTRELLTRVSENIDRDSVVRDADKIHNMDLIELHKVMSQLDADSLKALNNELHVGTSYLNETNKNVFFEVLPHVRSADSARLVKYLVVEFADQKFEDATALSLIRKLPFNVAEYSQDLLVQMEDLLNLTPEVSQDIRHASILSFATLAFHTYINGGCSADEFEGYVQKYFRMYTECPSYADRLVWLQGLANLQVGSVSSYLGPLIQDQKVSRHERFLAIWATMSLAPFTPESTTSLYWPILTDPNEHIQLRISALMMLLFGEQSPSRVLSLHQYVSTSDDNYLKRFWYTTVKSFEKSTFSCFHPLAKLTSYVSKLVRTPDPRYWATGNYIIDTSDDDRDSAAMGQLWSIAEPMTGHPAVVYLTVNSNQAGLLTNQIAVMVKAEGVTANFLSKLMSLSFKEVRIDTLSDLLSRMKVETKTPELVHIEVLVSIQDKTVYATHLNQTTFDKWTGSDMVNTVKDFLMSESHVNQQLVQYPLQTDINLPTELGTPITLQTTWSSFFSVRGTMTSPSTSELLVRKNDVHFRYHGTAVTTLSSYGPLLGSEHSVTIQQSLVAHLPLKLDLTFSMLKKILDLKWLNEDQTGGVALHSRSQVSLSLGYGRELRQVCPNCQDTYTVRVQGASSDQGDPSGVFFDCDRPMTGVELLEKLLDSNRANYDFFSSLRPTLILVHGLYLLSVPPSGACGVVVPSRFPFHLKPGTSLDLSMQFAEFEAGSEEQIKLKVNHALTWKESGSIGDTLLNINGSTMLENTNERLRVASKLSGYHPMAVDFNRRYWQICIEEKDIYRVPGDQDISIFPSPFQGELKVAFDATAYPSSRSCPDAGSLFHLKYSGDPIVNYTSQEISRYFDVKLYGKNLPNMTYLSDLGFGHVTALGQILERVTANPFNVTASISEWDGIADVTIDQGPRWQFQTDNFSWLLDYWSNTQLLKKFGIYRECRLQERTVSTLSGVVEQLQPPTCSESLALADCTEKPRFALLRLRGGGYKFYTGDNYVTITPLFAGEPKVTVNGRQVDYSRGYKYPEDEKFYDFKITNAAGAVRVSSRISGVQLFYKMSDTVILVPDTYMSVACGSCASSRRYNLCP